MVRQLMGWNTFFRGQTT